MNTKYSNIDEIRNSMIVGNARDIAIALPNKSIHNITTSPPYFDKRVYAKKQLIDDKYYAIPEQIIWDQNDCQHEWTEKLKKVHNGRGDAQKSGKYSGQKPISDILLKYWICNKCNAYMGELGHEKSYLDYIEHLASIFDILYDKLTDDGSCWVNLGDSTKKGEQLNIPILFAERMKKRGWILKRVRPWIKKNAMPNSDPNNYTMDYEYFLWFTKKRNKYYFQTQYRPYADSTLKEILKDYDGQATKDYEGTGAQNPSDAKRRMIESIRENISTGIKFGGKNFDQYNNPTYSGNEWKPSAYGALERATIILNTKGTRLKHYAAFSIDLPKMCIVPTCPTHICSVCGHKRKIAYKERKIPTRPGNKVNTAKSGDSLEDPNAGLHQSEWSTKRPIPIRTPDNYLECTCENRTWIKGICLDPFGGTGSTGVAAMLNGNDYILFDNDETNAEITKTRFEEINKKE